MTTRSSAEHLRKRLVAEIEQLLDSGPVGLYEFIWILRMWPEAQDAIHSIAFDSLKELLSRPQCKLKWDKWPIQKPLRAELRRIEAIPAGELDKDCLSYEKCRELFRGGLIPEEIIIPALEPDIVKAGALAKKWGIDGSKIFSLIHKLRGGSESVEIFFNDK